MTTTAEAQTAFANKVRADLLRNYDGTAWNIISSGILNSYCQESLKLAVFTVDLSAFETYCTAATDGCTFVKDNYAPYALGVLRTTTNNFCIIGPDILIPNTQWSFSPNWKFKTFTQFSSVSWDTGS